MASPMRGSCRRRRLMRWTVPRKRNCPTSSVTASPCRLPLIGEGIGGVQIKNSPRKGADQQIWPVPSMDGRYSTATSYKSDTPVSGGAYQDARKVSIVWNARPKHRFLPEFRGRKHLTRPITLFSPIFSLAREKIGPPEARQNRPRRNEPPLFAESLFL